MPSFFFCVLQLVTVLLLICDFYMSTRFVSLKLYVGFFIINVFIKFYIFVKQNAWIL